MYTYYISLGSNMGDKRGYISSAFQSLLQHEAIFKLVTSSLIETEPWGYTEQDTFINGVWSCESTLKPHQMLSLIQQLEQEAGRKRLIHWGPRT
ncbi:2-amino-4-hydroxy-6-hydroxymethyldihydropteridine diphosphokinase, partial [Veillonella parvula]|uniref:2-amino-4-hydroxy-6- hydroxymethyldihydropteridine diphosphokinase n=1 Tax=Veillonella parvula TaxID=29466 RepID=UPI00210A4AFB